MYTLRRKVYTVKDHNWENSRTMCEIKHFARELHKMTRIQLAIIMNYNEKFIKQFLFSINYLQ